MAIDIYAGGKAPEKFSVTVTAGASGLDMTTVTVVSFELTNKKTKKKTTWATTIQAGATSSQLVAAHTWDANGEEIESAASMQLFVILTVPGGFRRAGPLDVNII